MTSIRGALPSLGSETNSHCRSRVVCVPGALSAPGTARMQKKWCFFLGDIHSAHGNLGAVGKGLLQGTSVVSRGGPFPSGPLETPNPSSVKTALSRRSCVGGAQGPGRQLQAVWFSWSLSLSLFLFPSLVFW